MKLNFYSICLIIPMIAAILFLTACSSKEKTNQRLKNIQEEVISLYNEAKTDLSETISEKTLKDIEQSLEEAETQSLEKKQASFLTKMRHDFKQAEDMFVLQSDINRFIHQKGEIDAKELSHLQDRLTAFTSFESFHGRHQDNIIKIEKAYKAAKHNKQTERALATLFTKENEVIDGITQEQYDQVAKLVAQVQDKDTKARFESILHKIEQKLITTLLAEQDVNMDNIEIEEEQEREERDIEKEVNMDKTQETQGSSRPSMQTSKPQKASYQSSRPASKPSQSKPAKKKPSAKPDTDKQKPTKPSGSSSSDKVGNSNNSDATENHNNEEHAATNPSQPPTAPSEKEASNSTNQAGE